MPCGECGVWSRSARRGIVCWCKAREAPTARAPLRRRDPADPAIMMRDGAQVDRKAVSLRPRARRGVFARRVGATETLAAPGHAPLLWLRAMLARGGVTSTSPTCPRA